jgi:hypothetical protein
MKKIIKNYFMAMVAVVMVIGFSAFKVNERNTVEFGEWHTTDGNNNPIIQYVNLTGLIEGEDYICDPDPGVCTVVFNEEDLDAEGNPLPEAEPTTEKPGQFNLR